MISDQQLASRIDALPTVPEALPRISTLLLDPSASASDFEAVVKTDPALTANLLRVANSAFHRGLTSISSVGLAVARVGFHRVYEVVSLVSLKRALPPRLPGYGLDSAEFWRHCVAVAVLSERIARLAGVPESGHAYTAGLLHDVGKLVVGVFGETEGGPPEGALDGLASEQRYLGTDHAEIGQDIAFRWNFTRPVADAARWHHAPLSEPGASGKRLQIVVHVANCLAHRFGYGPKANHRGLPPGLAELADRTHLEFEEGALETLGQPIEALEKATLESKAVIEEATQLG